MTHEQLEAIRKRAEKATEGPWSIADTTDGAIVLGEDDWIIGGTFDVSADGVFCANAREDIPALLAEVERLNGVVGALISQLELIEELNEFANVDGIVKGAIKYASEEIR